MAHNDDWNLDKMLTFWSIPEDKKNVWLVDM